MRTLRDIVEAKLNTVFVSEERIRVRRGHKTYTYTRRVLRFILPDSLAKYSRFEVYVDEIERDGRKIPCILLVPSEQ